MLIHAGQAILALKAGKHVLSEVIGSQTVEESWKMIEAVKETGLIYMMAENYCYTRENMMIQHMASGGAFGEITYAECGYIHDVRDLLHYSDGSLTWRGEMICDFNANTYPTHSLGPIAKWLGINKEGGDAFDELITVNSNSPRQPEWIEQLRAELPGLKSIVQNVNEHNTNVIFGDETRTLWGSDVIYDELDGIRFAISARSFYQVNPAQTVALYSKAVEYAALSGDENVIDAYCGIGTISLFLARKAGHVYGVEIVPEAIEDAKRNAALNGVDNATFEAGPAEVVIPRWRKEGAKADVIVVDPPRKGCDSALLDTILKMRPERVVYVSCNPSTLARDLRVLEDGGYRTVEVTPVDMFPWTARGVGRFVGEV